MRPLAITGVGSISPLGLETGALLDALDRRRHGFGQVAPEGLPTGAGGWAARIPDFDSRPYISSGRARRLDRASLFAVAAARLAIASASLADSPLLAEELGVIVGTSSAGSGPLTVFLDALFRQSPEAAPPFEFPNTVANAPASHVSIELGLKGPNATLSHSEAVLGQALLYGRLMLEDERCSALLVGAVDEWNPYYQLGYSQLGALRSSPGGGGGTLLAEGATLLVLEPPEAAERRGAQVVARVLGVGVTSAPGEPYRWVPSRTALERAVAEALERSGLTAREVGSVFLAANGVAAMEEAEAAALAGLFPGRRLAASGVKGAVGERATSGALTLAVAALARQRRRLPPFAGGALGAWPDAVAPAVEPVPLPPGAMLALLYGFGGNYAAVVLD